jgi:periplasmic protein TonB
MTHRDSYESPDAWRGGEAAAQPEERAPFRLPTEMPLPKGENRTVGLTLSVLIHALIVLLFLLPMLLTPAGRSLLVQGAGGDGPRGGGGGGTGPSEGLRFMRIAPEPAPQPQPTARTTPPIATPVPPPVTPPVVQPPVKTPPEEAPPTSATASPDAIGPGGGSGTTTGAGPGTGGGIGSGVGTGTGSSVGPGTGGGNDPNYPPQPINTPLPPLPVPQRIRPFKVIAEFDVDSTGRVLGVNFTETPDGGYNRKLKKMFSDMRFRPGVRPDGSPTRSKGQVILYL